MSEQEKNSLYGHSAKYTVSSQRMAQLEKALAAKPDNLSTNVVKRENKVPQSVP